MSHRKCWTCRQAAEFVCMLCRRVFCTLSGCPKSDEWHDGKALGPFGSALSIVPREPGATAP